MRPEEEYDRWHAQRDVDDGVTAPWHVLVREHLLGCRDIEGKRVLEIGCGRGGFSHWLQDQKYRPAHHVAADFSNVAIEKARAVAEARGITRIHWMQQDIEHLSLSANSFDTVISCETIEHVTSPEQAIRQLARVLSPGGRLFLTTPNYIGSLGLYRVYQHARKRRYQEDGQPINRWMFLPLTARWVRRSGLKVEAIDGIGHYAYLPGAPPIRLRFFDRFRGITKWTATHSFVCGLLER